MRGKTLHGFKLMQTTNSLPLLSLICWVYFITFIAFCCYIKKIKCKTLCSNRKILQVYTYLCCAYFWPSKRDGGGLDYWFIQGPLDGIEICLIYTATDVYIAWGIRLVIQSESLHFLAIILRYIRSDMYDVQFWHDNGPLANGALC